MSTIDWSVEDVPPETEVRAAFEGAYVTVEIQKIIPLKVLRDGLHESKKYAQVVSSIRAIGLVEAPVVIPGPEVTGDISYLMATCASRFSSN